jgi:NADH-quinone oxidoreductase subunit J
MLFKYGKRLKIFTTRRGIKLFSILIATFVFVQLAFFIFYGKPSRILTPDESASVNAGTIQTIGRELYTNYIIPFEVAGFLLLAATIGALVLAKKKFD